jgi:hypothetical protein
MDKKTEYRWVPLDQIFVDIEHQRPEQESWVDHLFVNWDEDKAQVPHLSQRSETLYHACDGQHQIAARRRRGEEGLWAKVHFGLTGAEESGLFASLNEKRGIHVIVMFVQSVKAGFEPFVSIDTILSDNGWRVARSGQDRAFASVTTLRHTADKSGITVVKEVVNTITLAWGHQTEGAYQKVVGGLCLVYAKRDNVDPAHMVDALKRVSPLTVRQDGEGTKDSTGVRRYANAIIRRYNKGLKVKEKLELFS